MLSTLNIIISITALIGVIYLVRLLRAVNTKINKVLEVERYLRGQSKEIKQSLRGNYIQSEFYSQLISLLKLDAPIPATRNWAASPDVLVTLFNHAKTSNPKKILDLGSGISTLVLAKAAPQATIFSIDNSEEYAAKTRKMLDTHRVGNVDLRVAPLTPHASGVDWYAEEKFVDIADIDILFIDGPPGALNETARHPAFDICLSKLSPRAVIVLDDVAREGERNLAEKFAAALPHHKLEILDFDKGAAVLLPH